MDESLESTNKALTGCKICGRFLKSLAVHLKAVHNVTVADYRQQFPGASIGVIGVQGHGPVKGQTREEFLEVRKNKKDAPMSMVNTMSTEEKEYSETRFNVLNRESGYDPTVTFVIRQIVQFEILLNRYQQKVNDMTFDHRGVVNKADELQKMVAVIEKLTKQHTSLMDVMNLSRKNRDAQKKQLETTPSRIITAFQREVDRFNPSERRALDEDILDAVRRSQHNQSELLNTIPRSASGEEEEEEDIDDLG
jgi:hypothetical protein